MAKSWHKGNLSRAVQRLAAEYLDPYGAYLIAFAALWVFLEAGRIIFLATRRR
jgi:hypothetical protein